MERDDPATRRARPQDAAAAAEVRELTAEDWSDWRELRLAALAPGTARVLLPARGLAG
ncbi:hypothetical protein [Streptomyces pini]|uniref:Uncharacterized protein n=1 Tax=Streptomyces pini TaxID=1520580 RepID=A0A1I3XIV8_9ACTN|nr:hypothetical protein SAMN05192584_104195 [Streptomyces pini]